MFYVSGCHFDILALLSDPEENVSCPLSHLVPRPRPSPLCLLAAASISEADNTIIRVHLEGHYAGCVICMYQRKMC